MKAAVYKRYGSPKELLIEDVPMPVAQEGEVLVRIHASSVNRTDCGFLRGRPLIVRLFSGLRKPKSTILGCEFSGEIVEVGDAVTDFAVGDRVFGFKDDDFGFGGHAEYTTMPIKGTIAHIPENFSYEEVAPGFEGSHYALHYIKAAEIAEGQSVLVNGATGAIGYAAVQIIKHLGARVTAVCEGRHVELVKSLGADDVINYEETDFTKLEKQFDIVFDAVGKSTFGRCKNIIKAGGLYMSTELGPYVQNPFLAILTKFYGKRRVLFPLPENTRQDADYLCELMQNGAFRPVIDKHYKLDDIVDAFDYVEKGMKVGNVVIKVA